MTRAFLVAVLLVLGNTTSKSQGTFVFGNPTARTRIGSIDGPLAGRGIWAQMLVGPTSDALFAVGAPLEHSADGLVGPRILEVAGIPCPQTAYIQMTAWDGRLWGSLYENVPVDQLGRTDIVPHVLAGCDPVPPLAPLFTIPAVVPPIPEPSVVALSVLGGLGLLWTIRGRTRAELPSASGHGRHP
jgi:hypothetical protein